MGNHRFIWLGILTKVVVWRTFIWPQSREREHGSVGAGARRTVGARLLDASGREQNGIQGCDDEADDCPQAYCEQYPPPSGMVVHVSCGASEQRPYRCVTDGCVQISLEIPSDFQIIKNDIPRGVEFFLHRAAETETITIPSCARDQRSLSSG